MWEFLKYIFIPNFNRKPVAFYMTRRFRWEIERIVAYDKSFEDGVKCDIEMTKELKTYS